MNTRLTCQDRTVASLFGDLPAIALLCATVFAAYFSSLGWHDFRDGMENFVVVTADETRREGTWLFPTLLGEVRYKKPPLSHWTTAASLAGGERLGLDEEAAARAVSLLMAVLAIPAVYLVGRLMFSRRVGVIAATVFASSYFFIKYSHKASYDAQLVLFTTWGLAGLCWAMFRGAWFRGCSLAGLALGLGFLTKGPPALVSTLLPTLAYVVWRWCQSDRGSDRLSVLPRRWGLAVLLGIAVFAVSGLWWYLAIQLQHPGTLSRQIAQATLWSERVLEGMSRSSSAVNLFMLLAMTMPWAGWFFAGVARTLLDRRQQCGPEWLALALVVVPPVVMLAAAPLRERYMFPCVVGGALLAAWVIDDILSRAPNTPRPFRERLLLAAHACLAGGVVLGAAVLALMTPDGAFEPVLPVWVAASVGTAGLAAVVVCTRFQSRCAAILAGPVVAVCLAQALFFYRDQFTPGGRSTAKPVARALAAAHPNARFVYLGRGVEQLPLEFAYYLGRTLVLTPGEDLAPIPGRDTILLVMKGKQLPPSGALPLREYRFRRDTWQICLLPAAPAIASSSYRGKVPDTFPLSLCLAISTATPSAPRAHVGRAFRGL